MSSRSSRKRKRLSSDKRDKRSKWSRSRRTGVVSVVPPKLRRCLSLVPRMSLKQLPNVIDRARSLASCAFQEDVVRVCLQRILDHGSGGGAGWSPRTEQVRALRRLIFGESDVLLIARTGFGKSLIFHAYTVLTGKITLQIIPLTKLGDEQLDDSTVRGRQSLSCEREDEGRGGGSNSPHCMWRFLPTSCWDQSRHLRVRSAGR